MACIVSVQEGVHDLVKASVEGDSLFLFRRVYFNLAREFFGSQASLEPGAEADFEVFSLAAEMLLAEHAALRLLERAEQSRFGLSQKLAKRDFSKQALKACLDFLEDKGLLSDTRFASSWIRGRVRRHAEGPVSLKQALASKGIASKTIALALDASFSGDARIQALDIAKNILEKKHPEQRDLRYALRSLGYGSAEIDECLGCD